MPNHVTNTLTITGDASLIELLEKAVDGGPQQPFDFHRIVPMPPIVNEICPDGLSSRFQSQHPHRNWYDWSIEHWGTKWNTYDVQSDEPGCYRFGTAWSPPLPVIATLSQLFPELCFEIESEEEFDGFHIVARFENGDLISERSVSHTD